MYRVMIVDDESLIARGLEKIIDWKALNCQVSVCTDSLEACRAALASPPQILITDIRMPDLDGLGLVRRLKNAGSAMQAILLSGYSDFEYARKGIELGVSKYLLKPVDQDELRQAVEDSIARLRDRRPSAGEAEDAHRQTGSRLVERVKAYIHQHYAESITLAALSERFYINPYYLSQLFKQKTGQSYVQFLMAIRIEKARELLAQKEELPISVVCHRVGYENVQHFSRTFQRMVGVRPSEYRKGQRTSRPL